MKIKAWGPFLCWLLFAGVFLTELGVEQRNYHYEQPTKSEQGERAGAPRLINPEQHDQEGRYESQWYYRVYDKFIEHITDWLLVLFSCILAIATIKLVDSTNGLWEEADKQRHDNRKIALIQAIQTRKSLAIAKKSADAADLSARTFSIVETPHIVFWTDVEIAPKTPDEPIIKGIPRNAFISVKGANIGRNSAILLRQAMGIKLEKHLPEIPEFLDEVAFPAHTVLQSERPVTHGLNVAFDDGAISYIVNRDGPIYLYGVISYLDVFGGTHFTKYCFRGEASENEPHTISFSIAEGAPIAYVGAA
jgi:hypothetical protein